MKVLRVEGKAEKLQEFLQQKIDEGWSILNVINTDEKGVYLILALEPKE